MNYNYSSYRKKKEFSFDRIVALKVCIIILGVFVIGRLFQLQVVEYKNYNERALKKYNRTITIPAERGEIFLKDKYRESYYTLAINTTFDLLYVDPSALEERFELRRDLVLRGKLSAEKFPYSQIGELYDEMAVSIGEIVSMKPGEVKKLLMNKYNNHITLLYEPEDSIVFLLQEQPIESVYLVSEYDQLLNEVQYESEDYKYQFINSFTPEEKDEMRSNIVEIYVDPTEITQPITEDMPVSAREVLYEQNQKKINEIAAQIYKVIFDYSMDDLHRVLTRKQVRYQPIKKKLSLEESKAIEGLDYYGIVLQPESYRLYPEGDMLANVLGFVDKQGVGRYSIEGQYDIYLRGQDGYRTIDIDNLGNQITVGDEQIVEAVDGQDLILTIDRSIQQYVEKVLKETVDRFYADGGQVVVMDPQTGSVMAMASYPTYDPNEYYKVYEKNELTDRYLNDVGPKAFFNPSVAGTYEPGSTYKVFTVAAAVDSGELAAEGTVCDETGKAEITVDGHTYVIQNASEKAHGCMTLSELLEKSSNIGALRVSLQTGARVFRKYMKNFGFSEFTDVGLEDENTGYIKDIREWGKVMLANAGFGQGFTVTPIQLVAAVGAIANDGVLMRPYLIEEKHVDDKVSLTEPFEVRRAIKPSTAQNVKNMMVSVVDNGLGDTAAIPGYSVGGKTGTSQVAIPGGGYSREKYITSFVGFAPEKDPAFVMLVKIDHPKSQKFGSIVAAPAFREIGEYILKYLEVPKDR